MPRVEPEQLVLFDVGPNMSKIREASAALKRRTRAPQTHVAYECDWRAFSAWCTSTGRPALPASAETLALYAAARLQPVAGVRRLRASTVERHVAAIAFRHRAEGAPVPDRAEARAIIEGARRQRLEQPRQRLALTVAMVRKIAARLVRAGTAEAARTRALLALGIGTGLRRSNLVALDLADVSFASRKGVLVRVRQSKTDQTGRGRVIGVFRGAREETCPVRCVRAWLAFRGLEPGPLFTRIREHGPTLGRLGAEWVNQEVKAAVRLIGVAPAGYGAHSMRAGFVTAAHNCGTDVLGIMEVTGHKSAEMVRRYLRNADPFGAPNPLARAL
ncbi:MAG: tyrosine-type recombinase/integrase [Candidatus Solibacter sp.]|jgi:integrase